MFGIIPSSLNHENKIDLTWQPRNMLSVIMGGWV